LRRTVNEQLRFFSTLLACIFVERHGSFLMSTSGRLAAAVFR
jgi:hypothetical protein